ncbi:MAG TPA: hypothetical protein VKM93_09180 [Terriglobia bacterium]|nr:hypothetical protein [Terriglobia bacterium]
MVEPSNSAPPAEPERPKRKYTVSDRVLAANRLNLVQANANPEKKYRPTPKRLASTYSNCLKARDGKRQKRLRGQATGVKYGLAVTDLYSTLGLADASREDLDEHYRLLRGVVQPDCDDDDKLAKALAECGWRRSQVLHVYAVDEAMLMKARLMMASDDARSNVPLRSLAVLMMDVFNRRRPDLEEQLGILTRHFERLSYVLLLLRSEHEGFGEKINWGPHGRQRIDELLQLPAEALGNPFLSARQVEAILCEKWNWVKPLEEMKWKGKKKKQEERQAKFQQECEEAIYGGSYDEKVKRPFTTAYVKDGGQTRAVVGEGQPVAEEVMVEETGAVEAGLNSREWPEEEERKLVAELRRQWIETSEQLRAEGKETVGGVDLDELEEALKAGFGIRGSGFAEPDAAAGESEGVEGEEEPDDGTGEFVNDEQNPSPAPGASANADVAAPQPSPPSEESANPEPQNPESRCGEPRTPNPEPRVATRGLCEPRTPKSEPRRWAARPARSDRHRLGPAPVPRMVVALGTPGNEGDPPAPDGEGAHGPRGSAASVPGVQENPVRGAALRGQTARRAVPVSEPALWRGPGIRTPQ